MIIRRISGKAVRHVLDEKGSTRLYCTPFRLPRRVEFNEWHSVEGVRAFAAALRANGDHVDNWGRRPVEPVAAGLEALADDADARPVADSDVPNLTGEELALLNDLHRRCLERSPLLVSFGLDAAELVTDPTVGKVRRLLSVLADVDLLLPGTDAELRPMLTSYAGVND